MAAPRGRTRLEWCRHGQGHLGPQGAGRGEEGPPPDLQMECGPADILLLDFWLPELWERTFLSFLNPQFVVIFCYGSSRKLIQRVTCLQEKPLKPAPRAGLLLERRGRESGWRIPGGRASGTGTGLSREAGRADLNFQRPWGTEGNLSLG